jgi:hypothetical protein
MFAWMVVPALAGELEVTVTTDEGLEEQLEVEYAVACQRSTYSTRSKEGRMSISAEVRPSAVEGEWLVFLDFEGRSFADGGGLEEVKMAPTMQVADGKRGRLVVASQGRELQVGVKVKGFDPATCELTRGRTEHRVHRERREVVTP